LEKDKSRWPMIPVEEDWGNYQLDLDQKWAHDHYAGRCNEEMQLSYRNNPVEAASDIRFMPPIPFRYYLLGYQEYVLSRTPEPDPDAASCFLRLVLDKLKAEPNVVLPIIGDLWEGIDYVASHQAEYEADEEIYGSFVDIRADIRRLVEECGTTGNVR
jgi:hypothetical protein